MKWSSLLTACTVALSLSACERATESERMSSAKISEFEDAEMYLRELSPSERERWQAMIPSQIPISTQTNPSNGTTASSDWIAQILRGQSYFTETNGQFNLLKVKDGRPKLVRHVDVVATPTDVFLSDDGSIVGYRYFDGSPKVTILSGDSRQDYELDGFDVLGGAFSNGKLFLLARVKHEVVVLRLSGGTVAEVARKYLPDTDFLLGQRCEQRDGDGIAHLLSMKDGRSLAVRVKGDGQLNLGPELEGRWAQCFAAGDQIVGVVRADTGRLNVIGRTARGDRDIPSLPEGAGRVVFNDRGDIVAAYRSVWSATDGMVPAVWFMRNGLLEPTLYHDGGFGPRGSALVVAWLAGQPVLLGQHNILEYRDGAALELISRGLNTNHVVELRSQAMAFYDIDYKQITVVLAI